MKVLAGTLPRPPMRNLRNFSLCTDGQFQWLCWEIHERIRHPEKICIKNFGGTLAGGSKRGLRRPNSLCRCWFSQQNTVQNEFRGGGLRGSWGRLRSNFGAPFLYVDVLFWGLTNFSWTFRRFQLLSVIFSHFQPPFSSLSITLDSIKNTGMH